MLLPENGRRAVRRSWPASASAAPARACIRSWRGGSPGIPAKQAKDNPPGTPQMHRHGRNRVPSRSRHRSVHFHFSRLPGARAPTIATPRTDRMDAHEQGLACPLHGRPQTRDWPGDQGTFKTVPFLLIAACGVATAQAPPPSMCEARLTAVLRRNPCPRRSASTPMPTAGPGPALRH